MPLTREEQDYIVAYLDAKDELSDLRKTLRVKKMRLKGLNTSIDAVTQKVYNKAAIVKEWAAEVKQIKRKSAYQDRRQASPALAGAPAPAGALLDQEDCAPTEIDTESDEIPSSQASTLMMGPVPPVLGALRRLERQRAMPMLPVFDVASTVNHISASGSGQKVFIVQHGQVNINMLPS